MSLPFLAVLGRRERIVVKELTATVLQFGPSQSSSENGDASAVAKATDMSLTVQTAGESALPSAEPPVLHTSLTSAASLDEELRCSQSREAALRKENDSLRRENAALQAALNSSAAVIK